MLDYALDFDSPEFISYREAIKLGVIDSYKLYDDCFIGRAGASECFVAAFSDAGIEHAIELLEREIESCTETGNKERRADKTGNKAISKTGNMAVDTEHSFEMNTGIETGFPLYMFRGTELARAFLEAHKSVKYEGEGFYEYIYRGDRIPLSDNGCKLKALDLSYLDVIDKHYRLADSDYIRNRLEEGVIDGLFDENERLVGFIGEHFEGAMGMLEIFPEFRKRGYGEYLECLRINKLISAGRVPFCNVFYNNKASVGLQAKIGLEKSSLDSWWISLS